MVLVVVEIEPQFHMAVALHNYVDPYDLVFAGGHSGALGDAYGDAFANGRGGALGVTSTCTPKCTCASKDGVYNGFVGGGYCERSLPVVK